MNNIQKFAISVFKNEEVVCDNINYESVLDYYKRNSISLIELANKNTARINKDFFESEHFKKAYSEEENLYKKWATEFTVIKEKWDAEKIDYIFHKSINDFPYLSGNLDILVREKDFTRAGEILKEIGYIDLRSIQEAHKEYYRKFEGEKEIIPIHLHKRVCWVVPFCDIDHIWENYKISEDDPLVHYPGNDDAALIICAHHFLEDHQLSLFDLKVIRECIKRENIDWNFVIKTAENMRWDHSLYTVLIIFEHLANTLLGEKLIPDKILKKSKRYVRSRNWIRMILHTKILKKNIKLPMKISHLWTRIHTTLREFKDPSFGTPSDRFIQVFGGLADRFIQLKLKVAAHPNLVVSFSGVDGSGKSTHINNLRKAFDKCGVKTEYYWNRAGSMPFTTAALKLYRFLKYGKTEKKDIIKSENTDASVMPKNNTTSGLWRFLTILDMIVWYNIKLRFFSYKGRVIITDRYIMDNIIDIEMAANNPDINRFIYKIVRKLIPELDRQIFISLSPQTIIDRGCDERREEIELKHKLYSELIKKDENILIIDNEKDISDASSEIINKVITSFFDKYPDKFDGYKVKSWRYK
ncbi:MAG: hypothetical protein CSB55_08675 [Candidatus Cloacimonadota bacterium]|nr:MAG: hypothetical protein CSB55_08675 [Candidatus Cloacimonadota bacterium]